jgi:predicted ester cyclase
MTHDELIDAYQAAWSGKDAAAFAPICTDDVHYEDPLTHPLTGAAEIGAHAERLWAGFPDARVERTGPRMVDGDHVCAPMKLVATHRGELEGLPPTGRFLVAQLVVVAERHADSGRLWRIRAFFDPYGAGVQLGILPEPGSLGGKALLMLRGFGLRSRT